jgi:hypothetical protein
VKTIRKFNFSKSFNAANPVTQQRAEIEFSEVELSLTLEKILFVKTINFYLLQIESLFFMSQRQLEKKRGKG